MKSASGDLASVGTRVFHKSPIEFWQKQGIKNNQLDMLNNLFKCAGSIIKVLFLEILIEHVQEQRNLFEA